MSKSIVITGTSNGLGKDVATTLAAARHNVFATMRNINGRNCGAAAELPLKGIEGVELDVKDDRSVDVASMNILAKLSGNLDVVINNASLMIQGMSETIMADQAREMFDVNIFGIQRIMRAALSAVRKAGSGLTESYLYELSQLGVDVVLVQPSGYPTNPYSTHTTPADSGREMDYGPVAAVPKAFVASLQDTFGGASAPNPHDVAETLAKHIATRAGQRPARVVVGNPFGASDVNSLAAPIQAPLLSGIGMDGLATSKL